MRRRIRRVLMWSLIVYALCCVVSLIIVIPSLLHAAGDGRSSLLDGRDAILLRDASGARRSFARAESIFATARTRLRIPFSWPLRALPVVSTHVRVGTALAEVGHGVADIGVAAADGIAVFPQRELRLEDGKLDLDAVERGAELLADRDAAIERVEASLRDVPKGWVLPMLHRGRREVLDVLPGATAALRKAQSALHVLPELTGDRERKRYLVAFSNLSELRASGGLFGYVTVLEAENGDIDHPDLSGRPTEIFPPSGSTTQRFPAWFPKDLRTQAGIFQNLNLTTDFPTVADLVLQASEPTFGDMDGVIAVDPVGIAALLKVTGPIDVFPWPHQITADNVARVAMHDVYVSIKDREARETFFDNLVDATFDALTEKPARFTPDAIGNFDGAVGGGHFRMYSKDVAVQAAMRSTGLGGDADRAAAGDALSVVSINATGNKADFFLRRDIGYRVTLDPESGRAGTDLEVTFSNSAPASGLPDYIIGTPLQGLPVGTNRQIVMLVRSQSDDLDDLEIEGDPDPAILQEREAALRSYRSSIDAPSKGAAKLHATSSVTGALGDDMTYRLTVMPQAVVEPDFLDVQIEVPDGWRVKGATRFTGDLDRDVVMEVKLEREPNGVWGALLWPFRAAAGFFD